jgi:hypothetical protein
MNGRKITALMGVALVIGGVCTAADTHTDWDAAERVGGQQTARCRARKLRVIVIFRALIWISFQTGSSRHMLRQVKSAPPRQDSSMNRSPRPRSA